MLSLGIDGGASSAKWTLIDQNKTIIKRGSLEAIDGHLYRPESEKKFDSFLQALKLELNDLAPQAITLGITGLGSPELLQSKIQHAFPSAHIHIDTDISLAYKSEFDSGEGIYVYAGTGSIAIHITKEEEKIMVGGWGYLLGDEGGGYWIGKEAIRHLLRQLDLHEELDDLSQSLVRTFGSSQWKEIREYVYSRDRSAIAALSLLVLENARNQIKSAERIINEAICEIANLIQSMEKRLGTQILPIAVGGGVFLNNPDFLWSLKEKLGKELMLSKEDHSVTAALLALAR